MNLAGVSRSLVVLDITGDYYIAWVLDTGCGLRDTEFFNKLRFRKAGLQDFSERRYQPRYLRVTKYL